MAPFICCNTKLSGPSLTIINNNLLIFVWFRSVVRFPSYTASALVFAFMPLVGSEALLFVSAFWGWLHFSSSPALCSLGHSGGVCQHDAALEVAPA